MFKATLQEHIDGSLERIAVEIYDSIDVSKRPRKLSPDTIKNYMEIEFFNRCKDQTMVDETLVEVRELTRALYKAKTGECSIC